MSRPSLTAKFDPRNFLVFKVLSRLCHSNIVRILGYAESDQDCCMVMEYAAGGSLHSILSSTELKANLSPNSRLYVAHALVSALEYLHSHNIFHRDVKPENMCLWEDWENNPKMVLIDFGIASRVAERAAGSLLSSRLPGTPTYMADECLRQPQQFTEKSEVFACGVVFVNLLVGDCFLSFDHRTANEDNLLTHLDKSAGPWLANTDRGLAALASQCLSKNPGNRPTISDVLAGLGKLRDVACAEEFVGLSSQKRIQSHNRASRQTILPPLVGDSICVACGKQRAEGILCQKRHFTCSVGSCVEEMVREQLGDRRYKCPSPSCGQHFVLFDFYGKIGGDLYGQAVLAATIYDQNAQIAADLEDTIVRAVTKAMDNKLAQVEQNIKGHTQRNASDIVTRLSAFRDTKLELSSINAHVVSLLAVAEENSRKQDRWKKDLQHLLDKERYGEEASEEEEKELKEAIHHISTKLEKLSLSHASAVSLNASGHLQCPRLCLLWPVRSRRGIRSKLSIADQYQLVFLCAHDRSPIKTSVIIKNPKKWLRKATPFVKFSLFSLRILAAVYGIPVPFLPDSIVGNNLSNRVDNVLREMALLLEAEDIRSLEEWVEGVSDQRDLIAAIARRDSEISAEAYQALADEAYKPKNCGWKDEMEIAEKDGGVFAWVKKENVQAWKSTVA
jgi:Protein kinase domain